MRIDDLRLYFALWYGLVYFIAIVGAWAAVTVVFMFARLRRPPAARPPLKREPPDLANDPELHRFFARVNHAYRRPGVPPHAKAPAPSVPLNSSTPQPIRVRSDPEVIAEAPTPEVVRTMPDPTVLHSAPFHSPRPTSGPKPRVDPIPVLDARSTPGAAPPKTNADPGPTEQDLIVLVNLWAQLSEKDRRELVALARIKAGLDK
jgi:hypothetical protein